MNACVHYTITVQNHIHIFASFKLSSQGEMRDFIAAVYICARLFLLKVAMQVARFTASPYPRISQG